jgi:hypothetical protein
MNCNKCGTPILPGENSCRFCGTVGDYSKRDHEETKPEIIDFTTGDDDVVIIDDEPEKIESIPVIKPVSAPVAPMVSRPEQVVTPVQMPTPVVREAAVSVPTPAPVVMPVSAPVIPKVETPISIPVVTPIVSEPVLTVVKQAPVIPVVSSIDAEPIPVVKKEEVVEPIVKPQMETPIVVPVIPVVVDSAPTAVSASTPVLVTKADSKETKEEFAAEIAPVIEDKKDLKEKKSSHGLFNIVTFILIVLLLISVIANCFLLMGNSKENEEVDDTPVVSATNQTIYFNGYKVEVPSNWITTTNKDVNYITLMDSTENWAVTLNVAPNTNASAISDKTSIENITKAFGASKYLFTSDYSKTVDGKDFYIFKGKYYDYSVYIITSSLDSTNAVIADLKFKGEVDDEVLNNVLSSLKTVSVKDLTTFYKNDFSFGDIASLVTSNINVGTTTNIGGNE